MNSCGEKMKMNKKYQEGPLNIPKGSLWAAFPIPAFQVLSNAGEYQAQKVLTALLMHMGMNSNCIWPSYTQIARNVGMSRTSISKALTVLYNFGFIRIGRFAEGKHWRSRYYIQPGCYTSGSMNSLAKQFREKHYRCLACLKFVDRGDFGFSETKRVHFGCGGFVMPVKPRNNPSIGQVNIKE
jgi:DNA-binding transcriptional ArsR family regulator